MGVFNKIKRVSKVALEKGKELGKFAKLKFDIASLESEIKDLKSDIGNIVYKEKIEIKNDEIKKYIKSIDSKLIELKKKKTELKEMKDKTTEEGE